MRNSHHIAVIGYGSQGRAWALNLINSKTKVTLGIPSGSKSRRLAKKDGIPNITTPSKAVKNADLIIFAFPDNLHKQVFDCHIKPNMKPGACFIFLHAYSIHFKTIIPPDDADIVLLAPLGPGVAVREKYLSGESIGYFYSIYQNATGKADNILKFLVKQLKIDKSTMIETSFADEAVGDIFGEQAVLCGGLTQLIKHGYDTLVENGLSSDKAYLEVAYQLDLIVDLIKQHGIEGMYNRISLAAKYGSVENGPRIIDHSVKKNMSKIFKEIKSGIFAAKLNSLKNSDVKELNKSLKDMTSTDFEKSAKKFSKKSKSSKKK